VFLPDTCTSIAPITITLDIILTHILARRLQLAQGNLPVAVDANPHRLELATSVIYKPVRFIFSDN
jgi:hypothetical protein